MRSILVIDAGTTSFKVAIFDESLQLQGVASREFEILRPTTDRAELDPQAYWSACVETIREALRSSSLDARQVAAIAVTGHTDTLFALDADDEPVANAILWSDPRRSRKPSEFSVQIGLRAAVSNDGPNRGIVGAFCVAAGLVHGNSGRIGRTCRAFLSNAGLLDLLPERRRRRSIIRSPAVRCWRIWSGPSIGPRCWRSWAWRRTSSAASSLPAKSWAS